LVSTTARTVARRTSRAPSLADLRTRGCNVGFDLFRGYVRRTLALEMGHQFIEALTPVPSVPRVQSKVAIHRAPHEFSDAALLLCCKMLECPHLLGI
jgi:hypothetical protein